MKKQMKQITQSLVHAVSVAALFLAISVNSSQAQVPANFTYQGVLRDTDGMALTGSYNLQFKIYDFGGTEIWDENHIGVDVQNGVFNVILGDLSSITFDQQYYLGISVNGGEELTPRTKLTAVPYSLNTKGLPDNIVTTNKINNGAVTLEKLNTAGASSGQGLIFDGTKLNWQTQSKEFTLPFSGIYSGDSTAFEIVYDGIGGGGMDIYSSSPGAALSATNALDQGGPAAVFQITNSNSFGDVISVKNLGLGLGAYFENVNLANDASVIKVRTSGFGRAGNFIINNSNNSSDAIKAETIGTGRAALFLGDVQINGDQSVSGSKNFVIDHPLDLENKILRHSSVESSERINMYKGRENLIGGVAVIQLPHYFDALNSPEGREVNLTPVNGWAPLYLDGKIAHNQFTVRTTKEGNQSQEFSWLIYGVRNDKYAIDHPLVVEEEKGVNNNHFKKGELVNPDAVHARLIMESKNKSRNIRRH